MAIKNSKRAYLLTAAGLLVLALVWGCTGDDRGITPSIPTAQDSAFVQSLFGPEIVATEYQTIPVSLALLAQIPGKGGLPAALVALPVTDSIAIKSVKSYVYTNGWHIFDFGATALAADQSDTFYLEGLDSIKVIKAGLALEFPDSASGVDQLLERIHVTSQRAARGGVGRLHHADTVSLAYIGADTIATLDGRSTDTTLLSFDLDSSRCEVELQANQRVTDLRTTFAAEVGDCPLGGTVAMRVRVYALEIGIGKPPVDTTVMMNTVWTLDAVVADDHAVTITYSNRGGSWSLTSDCKGPNASPIRQ